MLALRSLTMVQRSSLRWLSTEEQHLKTMCTTVIKSAVSAATRCLNNPIGWELVYSGADTEVYRNTKITDSLVYMRKGTVPCPPMKVISFVRNLANAKKWNEPVIESKELKNLGEHKIGYQKVTMPWPVALLDMVFADGLEHFEDGAAYVMASVPYEDAPASGCRRSQLHWGALIAKENENNHDVCEVSYITSWKLSDEGSSEHEVEYLVSKRNTVISRLRAELA